jgi:hypothetical protein
MGEKLFSIFEEIKKESGLSAQMRLAMQTGIASPKAKEAPDSPENLKKFTTAYKEITGKNCLII